eukprot:TRINITY_DN5363_c0_g3_i1.p2 TRINITY_DN5363_c0_g3~~TRINITY_DN5363_c0_g3_i1.p2  ORF type:complete len:110 (-),score=0.34 TRINITY_DN5363_c0_g3_i1:1275-1604(-)
MESQNNVLRRSLTYDRTYGDSLQVSFSVHFKSIKEATLDTSVFNHKICLDFSLYLKNSRVGTMPKNCLLANFTPLLCVMFSIFETVYLYSQVYDNSRLHFRSEEEVFTI